MMKKIFLICILHALAWTSRAEVNVTDTIKPDIREIETIFLKNNLSLIASKFNIEASRAAVIQSRLWDNPTLYLEQGIYNPSTGKAFDVTGTGQSIIQIQQLFLLAGKRNKRINLATINSQIAEYEFYDLMRTLRFELRSAFFDTYFRLQTLKMYDEEILSLNKTLEIFDILIRKGAIANKEVIRIKSLLFTLESERLDILKQIYENQTSLNILLNFSPGKFIAPVVKVSTIDSADIGAQTIPALQDSALANRYDLKAYESQMKYQDVNLAYQRSLTVPDLRLGGVYDRAGSYIRNYTGLSLQMDLPLWNRNQGNISLAKTMKKQSQSQYELYRLQVISQVEEACRKIIETNKVFNTIDKNIGTDFQNLIDVVIKNYEKRNISLIEFVDYYQAYKSTLLEITRIKNDKAQAIEELNFYVGKNIIDF